MSDEHTERREIERLTAEEIDSALLDPQQHSTLAHQSAQQLLMATFNKKTKKWGVPVDEAVRAAVILGNHALSPVLLHMYYEEASINEGNPNSYHQSVRAKAARDAEQAP